MDEPRRKELILSKLGRGLQSKFRMMSASVRWSCDGLPFLLVAKKRTTKWMQYLPSFYVVITSELSPSAGDEDENGSFVTRMLNYRGKVIAEEGSSIDVGIGFGLVDHLLNGSVGHCWGIKAFDEENNGDLHAFLQNPVLTQQPCLVERVQEELVVRSPSCKLAVFTSDDETPFSRCSSCFHIATLFALPEAEAFPVEDFPTAGEGSAPAQQFECVLLAVEDGEVLPEVKKEPMFPSESTGVAKQEPKTSGGEPIVNVASVKWSKALKQQRVKRRPRKPPEPFEAACKICLYKFSSKQSFRKDQSWHCQMLDGASKLPCPVCRAELESKWLLTDHFASDHSDLGTCCCECLEIVPVEEDKLRKHFLKRHSDARRVVCPKCGLCVAETYLKTHFAEKHTDVKTAICHQCGKTFATNTALKVHLVHNHQPKVIPCSQCGKMFGRKPMLLKHLKIHTGVKAFKCSECEYRSCSQENIRLHVKKVHGKKGTINDITVLQEEKALMDLLVAKYLDARFDGK